MSLTLYRRLIYVVTVHTVFYSQYKSFAFVLNTTCSLTPAFTTPEGCTPCHHSRDNAVDSLKSKLLTLRNQFTIAPKCGDGIWYRVAHLDMSDPTQSCPSNWAEISTPVRTCERPYTTQPSCPGVIFSTQSLQYSKVCGRAIGYQYRHTDAFKRYGEAVNSTSVDDFYVDGLSVTHGGVPRTHIWTYAVGAVQSNMSSSSNCPCAIQPGTSPPAFVGNNYFCESGRNEIDSETRFFQADPVWDGKECEGECCSHGKSPPWFSVSLSNPTRDDIEVRICGDEYTYTENTPVQVLEIYIQ